MTSKKQKILKTSKAVYDYLEPKVEKTYKSINKLVRDQINDKNSVSHRLAKETKKNVKSTWEYAKTKLADKKKETTEKKAAKKSEEKVKK